MYKQLAYGLLCFFLLTAQGGTAPDNEGGEVPETPWSGGFSSPELVQLLRDLNLRYGPDTVSLVGSLLNAAVHSGSVLTATIRVEGNEARDGADFLVFRVETGIIFNTRTLNQTGQLTVLWDKVLYAALSKFESLELPADGVMIDLFYYKKSFPETDPLYEHVDEPGVLEEVKFYFPGKPLAAFLRKKLAAQTLLSQSVILIADTPVQLILPGVVIGAENGRHASNVSAP
jgi:hypothetical protein